MKKKLGTCKCAADKQSVIVTTAIKYWTKPRVLYGETTTDTMVNSKAMAIRIY